MRCLPNHYHTTYFCGPLSISPTMEIVKKGLLTIYKKLNSNKPNIREMNPVDHWINNNHKLNYYLCERYEYAKRNVQDTNVKDMADMGWSQGWLKRLYTITALYAVLHIQNEVENNK